MPIYEYECPECGVFEVTQRMSDQPLGECPACKEKGCENKVTRLISRTSFVLKGSGWYKTDYGSNGNGNGAKEKKGETSSKGDAVPPSAAKSDSSETAKQPEPKSKKVEPAAAEK